MAGPVLNRVGVAAQVGHGSDPGGGGTDVAQPAGAVAGADQGSARYVESEKWQDTKTWLRGFLRVQAMYSDAQVQKLRDDLINADATQMLTILKRIQAKHDALVWMHEASEKSRQLAVLQRDESVAAQEAAAAAARAAGSENVATAGGAQADTSRAARNKAGLSGPRRVDQCSRHVARHRMGTGVGSHLVHRRVLTWGCGSTRRAVPAPAFTAVVAPGPGSRGRLHRQWILGNLVASDPSVEGLAARHVPKADIQHPRT